MADFMIRFLLCNFFIAIIVLILLLAKQTFKKYLTSRMQYQLWFLFLGLLAIPFLPFSPFSTFSLFLWLKRLFIPNVTNHITNAAEKNTVTPNIGTLLNTDFTLSVTSKKLSVVAITLFIIWMIGILIMLLFMTHSISHLKSLRNSALPLENNAIQLLFQNCLHELNIKKNISISSTVFLKSPALIGLWKPGIYLPMHVISDCTTTEIRYMLLHELQHYKYKDFLVNHFMNLFRVLYWFHPLVRYALKEMRNDGEVACDTAVLQMLNEENYKDYGNTLIDFAEKTSFTPFPFVSGLSGNMKQMKRRIANIASYKKPTCHQIIQSVTAFGITAAILVCFVPLVSTHAADENRYHLNTSSKNITYTDFSSYFGNYDGSFVLYDTTNNLWNIYNEKYATTRVSPDSTYKIYDALFGLESKIITPENSFMEWDGKNYPFDAWNTNQTLQSALAFSVNWYFESIDRQLGVSAVNSYIQQIGYGNQNITGDFSSYWMESSLKISSIEQVELLKQLYYNEFSFCPENVDDVKNSIKIFTSENGNFYGKTGTGRVNGRDINGWFIGFAETGDNTYFFAINIQNKQNATGGKASEIALSILSDLNIWK